MGCSLALLPVVSPPERRSCSAIVRLPMARKLADSTVKRLQQRLLEEESRLDALLKEQRQEREAARLAETPAERAPEPGSAEAGSLKFEYEKALSLEQNLEDLLVKTRAALEKVDEGTYGICETCGSAIPLARLDALVHVTECVECATR